MLGILVLLLIALAVFYPAYINKWQYKIYGGMTPELKDSELYEDMRSGKSFCFMGDSITYGSFTEGIGWYIPLTNYIKGDVSNLSFGGWKVLDLIDHRASIPEADIYVIAIGINDILFFDHEQSAHTASELTDRLDRLSDIIFEISPEAKLYFISPWTFVNQVEFYNERGLQLRTTFSDWCSSKGFIYLDADTVILSVLEKEDPGKYMLNDFHPNSNKGAGLFSYAVLKADHERRMSEQGT